jgi:DNA-binding NarL/FixJ family response regulator
VSKPDYSQGIDALMQYKARQGFFNAVIVRHDMPQMNGLAVIGMIRKMGYMGRAIVMSNNLNKKDLFACQQCGISGFFSKPFEIDSLAAMLFQADN